MRVRARLIVATAVASASCVFAQFPGGGDGPGPGGPGGQGGPGGGGRGGDVMRGPGGMMMGGDGVEQAKAALKATDEEWQVLRPAIQKVLNARRAADAGLMGGQPRGMFGGRGGRGGPGGMGNDSFNGPNNSGPGGRGGMGNRGGGPPPGDGAPPPEAGTNNGGQGGQGRPGGQGPQGENRQNNTGGPNTGGPNAGGPNAGGPPGMMGAPAGPVGSAMNDLKTAAGKEGVKAEELAAKIAAVRAERKKAREALGVAVDELKALVTPEQEAMLIGLGFIE